MNQSLDLSNEKKREVEALLEAYWKWGNANTRKRLRWEAKHVKNLKDCLKWFQNNLQDVDETVDTLLNDSFKGDLKNTRQKHDWTQEHITNMKKCLLELATLKENSQDCLGEEDSRHDEEVADKEVDLIKEELLQFKAALKDSQDDAEKKQKEIDSLKKDRDLLEQDLKDSQDDAEKKQKEIDSLKKDRDLLEQDLKDTTQQFSRLVDELDDIILNTTAVEVACSSQIEPSTAITQKLKVANASIRKIKTKCAEQKRFVSGLKDRRKWRF